MRILCFGAVLWDVFGSEEKIGGAPFNVAYNFSTFGADVAFISKIGRDARGDKTLEKFDEYSINNKFLDSDSTNITGVAFVNLDENGNAVYEIPHSAFDEIDINDEMLSEISKFGADVFYFGTIEQRSLTTRNSLHRILDSVHFANVFYDVNLRMNFYPKDILDFGLRHCTILKMNEGEAAELSSVLFGVMLAEEAFIGKLKECYKNISVVIITCGKHGCNVYTGDKYFISPAFDFKKCDTVGSGDAFSAAFLYSYITHGDIVRAAFHGNLLGSYVTSKNGAITPVNRKILDIILNGEKRDNSWKEVL